MIFIQTGAVSGLDGSTTASDLGALQTSQFLQPQQTVRDRVGRTSKPVSADAYANQIQWLGSSGDWNTGELVRSKLHLLSYFYLLAS